MYRVGVKHHIQIGYPFDKFSSNIWLPLTYMRHMAIDQKLKEPPHPAVAIVQTERPTPISLNGLMLHKTKLRGKIRKAVKRASTYLATVFSPLIKTKYFSIFINLMKFQHIYYYRLPLELPCYPTRYLKPPVFSVMNIFFPFARLDSQANAWLWSIFNLYVPLQLLPFCQRCKYRRSNEKPNHECRGQNTIFKIIQVKIAPVMKRVKQPEED